MYVNIKKNDNRYIELEFSNIDFIRYYDIENKPIITVLYVCHKDNMIEIFRFINSEYHISYISNSE